MSPSGRGATGFPGRRPLVVGNWKMQMPLRSAAETARAIAQALPPLPDRDVAVAPSFPALLPVAERHATTVSAVAIAWTLAWPGVTGAIVGARTPDQVDGWIGAASLELDPRDLDEIARAVAQSGAGAGPALPR